MSVLERMADEYFRRYTHDSEPSSPKANLDAKDETKSRGITKENFASELFSKYFITVDFKDAFKLITMKVQVPEVNEGFKFNFTRFPVAVVKSIRSPSLGK